MRALSLVPVLLAAGLLSACDPTEEEFPEAYAKAVCSKLKKCDRADYEQSYDDKNECVEAWAGGAEWILDLGDLLGAEYSEALAGDCLSEIRRASCAEFDDGEYECEVFE